MSQHAGMVALPRRRFLSALAAAAVARPGHGQTPPVDPPLSNPAEVCGTWVLQQVADASELKRSQPALEAALATPGLRGFSLRAPWHAIDQNFGLLDAGHAIAEAAKVGFSMRFMAGRHTPARVLDLGGCASHLRNGERVPTPFRSDGSPNLVFEQEYEALLVRLAGWCRERGVRLAHLAWYGGDWAELNHGAEVRTAPGYAYAAWLHGHVRLLDLGVRQAGTDLAVEFPLSGHGPLNAAVVDLASYVVAQVGPLSRLVFVQANGWGPSAQEPDRLGEWGTPDEATETQKDRVWALPILRGLQAIQPGDYDWAALYELVKATQATYCEVYLPSFAGPRRGLLAEQIRLFAARCAQDGPAQPVG